MRSKACQKLLCERVLKLHLKKITAVMLALTGTPVTSQPAFENQTGDITHTYTGGWEHFVGGGVATFDCNGDGLAELYVAGGENPAQLLLNQSSTGGLTFHAATPDSLALTSVIGAYPLDIDSDGNLDLAVLRVGENMLLQGDGACGFSPFENLGFTSANRWTTAFSATWKSGNTLPTLAFGNYVDRTNENGPFQACDTNMLYRPNGDKYSTPIPLTPGYCPLSILFSDWGHQGRADLRISNDRHYYVKGGQEQLWAMETPARLYTPDDGWQKYMIWGMGIASRDLTGDGLPEIYLTSMGDQKMQALLPTATGPHYIDATYERGTTAHRPYLGDDGRPSTGWHMAFGDVENNGRDDIFIAKGNVEQMPTSAMADPNNLLIQHPNGTFSEAGDIAGIATMDRSRGAALVDLNLDGLLDLVVVNRNANLEIYRNTSATTGHWLEIALHQNGANPFAVGAWIEVDTGTRIYSREITIGGGHAGGSAGYEHFGLGTSEQVKIRVIWPDGTQGDWVEILTNQILLIDR